MSSTSTPVAKPAAAPATSQPTTPVLAISTTNKIVPAPTTSTPAASSVVNSVFSGVLGGPSTLPTGVTDTDTPLVLGLLQWSRRQSTPTTLSSSTTVATSTSQLLNTSAPVSATAVVAAAAPSTVSAALTSSIATTSPVGVAVSPNGNTVYALNGGTGGFFGFGGSPASVALINASTGQVTANTPLASAATGIVAGPNGIVYVLNSGTSGFFGFGAANGSVSTMNSAGTVTQTIGVGASPTDLAISGNNLYVLNGGSTGFLGFGSSPSSVTVIDTTNNTVSRTIALNSAASAIAASPTGTLYVTTKGSNGFLGFGATPGQVQAINPVTGTVTQTIAAGTAPGRIAFSPSGATMYVLNGGTPGFFGLGGTPGSLAVIDAATGQVGSTVPVGAAASDVIVSPNGSRVYVANGDDTVSIIDTASNTVVQKVAVDPSPAPANQRLALSPDATTLYATDGPENRIGVVSLNYVVGSGVNVLGTVNIPGIPWGTPVLSADGTHALVTTTVSSLTAGISTRIALVDSATGTQTGPTVTVPGNASGIPLLTADSTHAVVTTTVTDPTTGSATRVALYNTATGTQTGTALTIPGTATGSVLSADGTHALITTVVYDSATDSNSTRVAVLDTTTGAQTGTTLNIAGLASGSPLLLADRRHVLMDTTVTNLAGNTTQVALIDTTTGTQTGTTLTLQGTPPGVPVLSADGTHALITTSVFTQSTGDTTQVALIDTTTGTQTGTTVTLTGSAASPRLLSANGSQALITTISGDSTNGFTTRAAVFNTTTGAQTGSTLTLTGAESGSPVLAADGTNVVITTSAYDSTVGSTARLAVFNTTTGTQTGSTLTLGGDPRGVQLINGDVHHALITTAVYDSLTSTFTTRAVMVDLTTGAQTGTALNILGDSVGYPPVLSGDGSHALITSYNDNATPHTTRVAVLNAITGTQTGTTLTFGPETSASAVLLPDGTHALITTGSSGGTQVTLIDLTTGAQTGTPINLAGAEIGRVLLTANGTRALVTTYTFDPFSQTYTTQETVLQVG
ncbi:YncE family protein [Mycobacterium sp. OTB74]|uniref:YncE family protein n=1 Tax=Mycobacterium sp. OTB74 TaxID=1853452 RepID=UPI002473D88D|nr:YncE family protein [Mycobacterium sp. OTB74]